MKLGLTHQSTGLRGVSRRPVISNVRTYMEFLKNIAVNLKATGPAAVLVSLIGGITLLGLFGQGELAKSALNVLAVFSGIVSVALAQRS